MLYINKADVRRFLMALMVAVVVDTVVMIVLLI